MIQLLPEQLKALSQLKEACDEEKVDAVIIGATAYRVWVDDDRRTQDVDVALAADVDQLALVTDQRGCTICAWKPAFSTTMNRGYSLASRQQLAA
jgi:hypothetical protein